MVKQERSLARQAKQFWDKRDFAKLDELRQAPGAAKNPEVLYFAGLALSALNNRRAAIECWRKASELDPQGEQSVRALAYELAEQAPSDAAGLFAQLAAAQRATADDLTCLGEIRIKQDRLREAHDCLKRALDLDPDNSLAMVALAALYTQVGDRALALEFLQKAAATGNVDLADLSSDPEFEFLWREPTFEKMISGGGGSPNAGAKRKPGAPIQ